MSSSGWEKKEYFKQRINKQNTCRRWDSPKSLGQKHVLFVYVVDKHLIYTKNNHNGSIWLKEESMAVGEEAAMKRGIIYWNCAPFNLSGGRSGIVSNRE